MTVALRVIISTSHRLSHRDQISRVNHASFSDQDANRRGLCNVANVRSASRSRCEGLRDLNRLPGRTRDRKLRDQATRATNYGKRCKAALLCIGNRARRHVSGARYVNANLLRAANCNDRIHRVKQGFRGRHLIMNLARNFRRKDHSFNDRARHRATLLRVKAKSVRFSNQGLFRFISTHYAFHVIFRAKAQRISGRVNASVLCLQVSVLTRVIRSLILRSRAIRRTLYHLNRAEVEVSLAQFRHNSFRSSATSVFRVRGINGLRAMTGDSQYHRSKVLRLRVPCLRAWVYRGGLSALGANPSLRARAYPSFIFSARRERTPAPRTVVFSGSASRAEPSTLTWQTATYVVNLKPRISVQSGYARQDGRY